MSEVLSPPPKNVSEGSLLPPKPELEQNQETILIELMRQRGLQEKRAQLLPICRDLYQANAKNYQGVWAEFQLGHLLAAARLKLEMQEPAGPIGKLWRKIAHRQMSSTGLPDSYWQTSLNYRLSAQVLNYLPPFQVDEGIPTDEVQRHQQQYLESRQVENQKLGAEIRDKVPDFSQKSLLEEELFYMVLCDLNQERQAAGLPTFSHSLDAVYWCHNKREKIFFQKRTGDDSSWVGRVLEKGGQIVIDDQEKSSHGLAPDLYKARVLYHELSSHAANSFRVTRDIEGKIEILAYNDSLRPRTKFEKLLFGNRQATGLLEGLASFYELQYASKIANDAERRVFLGTRMSSKKLDEFLRQQSSWVNFLIAIRNALVIVASKKNEDLEKTIKDSFVLHQQGRMDRIISILNQHVGDAAGSFLALIEPLQGKIASDFIKADQGNRVRMILHLTAKNHGLDPSLFPLIEKRWGRDFKPALERDRNLETRRRHNTPPTDEELRRLARDRLLAGLSDHAVGWTVADIRATEISRRKFDVLNPSMKRGADTVLMIINGLCDVHQTSVSEEIKNIINASLVKDGTSWQFIVELKQAFLQLMEKRIDAGNLPVLIGLAQHLDLYFGGIIDKDIKENPVEFIFGLFWALDEYQLALMNQIQESLLFGEDDEPLVVKSQTTVDLNQPTAFLHNPKAMPV